MLVIPAALIPVSNAQMALLIAQLALLHPLYFSQMLATLPAPQAPINRVLLPALLQ